MVDRSHKEGHCTIVIRERLQAGTGRRLATLLAGAIGFIGVWSTWNWLLKKEINPLEAGQRIAFIAATFSVTAYNLRTRVVDLVLRIEGSPNRVNELCMIARNCGTKLTNLVVFFMLTAIVLGVGGYISKASQVAQTVSALSIALFLASIIQFTYILFAFERLERFMLDDAEKRARDREGSRLNSEGG